jgi:protein TonB
MFEQSLIDVATAKSSKWTYFVSTCAQVLLVGIMILIPLIYTEALPKQQLLTFLVAPPPPPPPPPPPAAAPVKVVKVVREFDDGRLTAPKEIPKEIAMIKEEELPPPSAGVVGVVGGVPGGVAGGSPGGVIGGIISATPVAAPPPPPPKVETPKRIKVGGQVQSALAISRPQPIYPPLAKQARISGTVRLEALISKQGTIESLRVIQGHPLLVQAALDAVRQWRYRPTVLNGEPVEVQTTIDVNFTLSQ